MLTPRPSKIVGGVLLGVALLFVASWFSPATRQICTYAYETYEKDCPAYSVPLFILVEIGEFLDAHNGAVIAAFTAILTVATILLWSSGERHSERELRAYIAGPFSSRIRGFNTPEPISTLCFRNSGKTPAHNVCVWTSSAVAIYPMENPPPRPTGAPGEGASVGVVGPGEQFFNETQSDIAVTQAERAEVIGDRSAYYVYGQISYRDSFGIERNSTFCRFFAGDRARRNDGVLATYHKWNDAT